MRRVFWKFFLIVWLTMMVSIAALFALTAAFRITPFSREIEESRISFAEKIAAEYLRGNDIAGAMKYAAATTAVTPSLALTIAPVADKECRESAGEKDIVVASGASCYRISAAGQPLGFWTRFWPILVPWASALLAAALAAYGLTRYLLQPVAQLREGLSALAKGQFDIRIAGKMRGRRDEIASLGDDFDTSAKRLDELRQTQQRLFHDVSHELRSPLSRLQAAMGILQRSPAKAQSLVERMNREVQRIDGLVGEILTLARLADKRHAQDNRQDIDIVDLLNSIVADAAFEAQARGIAVALVGDASIVTRVDGELVYRAFENVIRNAVRYTADQSSVEVKAESADGVIRVTVTDQGPGISGTDLSSIFEPFARGASAKTHDGFGLGLAIAKQAVEHHGGRIEAISRDLGGLSVIIEIPPAGLQ